MEPKIDGDRLRGSCLCGAVTIEVVGGLKHVPEACHCRQCRKQSSHFFTAVNVHRHKLIVQGEDRISWFRSSEKVERGFCSLCGSPLFWKPDIQGYEYTAVAMGVFDTPTGVKLSKHTFVGDKGDYYDIDDGLPKSISF